MKLKKLHHQLCIVSHQLGRQVQAAHISSTFCNNERSKKRSYLCSGLLDVCGELLLTKLIYCDLFFI